MNLYERFRKQNNHLDERQLEHKYRTLMQEAEIDKILQRATIITVTGNQTDDTINNYVDIDYVEDYLE